MMGPTVKASRIAIERGSDGYPPGVLDLANAPKRLYMLGNPEACRPSHRNRRYESVDALRHRTH